MSKLEEFRQKNEALLNPKDGIEAQHKAGKKTARERIGVLLDDASFIEIDKFVRKTYITPGFEAVSSAGEGVVCGYGTIDMRPVFVFAQDYAVLKGSLSAAHAGKILKTIEMAVKNGVPIIGMLDSDGARVSEGMAAIASYGEIIKKLNDISGVVPTVALVLGNAVGTAAYIASTMDFCFMAEGIGSLALHAPQIYDSAHGKAFDFGAAKNAGETGIAQFVAADEEACMADVRKLLAYLPSNSLDDTPFDLGNDDLNRQIATLGQGEVDKKELIRALADDGNVLEYQAAFAPGIVTAFGRINGMSVGFVANNGAMDGKAARKAARFLSVLDAYSIPVITLADSDGTQVEDLEAMLIADITRMMGIYASAGIPKITVVTGKAIGDGFAMMCPKALGADIAYAWPTAEISAMPSEMGGLLLYEDEIKAASDGVAAKAQAIEKYKEEYANPWQAAEQGVIDDIIEPMATRQMVAAALEMCISKRVETLPKKHRVATL